MATKKTTEKAKKPASRKIVAVKKTTAKKTVAKPMKDSTSKNKKPGRPRKNPPKPSRPEEAKPLGRPTDYRKEYDEQAFKFCLLGATDAILGDFFGVDEKTINVWKKEFPSFRQSISRGKNIADAEIANSFYMRAKGFTHKVEKPLVVSVGNFQSEVKIAKYTEVVLPDANACHKWLHNRQAKLWPDKQNVDLGNLPRIGVLLNLPEGYEQEPEKDQHDGDDSCE
jgi:hypothetical protein